MAAKKTKVSKKVDISEKKKPSQKGLVNKTKVQKGKKKVVSKKHPLAPKIKANKKKNASNKKIANNPELDDFEVEELDDDIIEEEDVPEEENEDNFDIEELSSPEVMPSLSSDDVVMENRYISTPPPPIAVPDVSTFDSSKYKYTSVKDGSQRVTVTVEFLEALRAQGYEVRITS